MGMSSEKESAMCVAFVFFLLLLLFLLSPKHSFKAYYDDLNWIILTKYFAIRHTGFLFFFYIK